MEDAIFKRGIDKLRLSWTVLDDLTMKKPFTDQELESLYNVPPANINAPSSPPAMEFPQVCVIRREIEMKCVCIRNAYHFMFPSFEMSFSFTWNGFRMNSSLPWSRRPVVSFERAWTTRSSWKSWRRIAWRRTRQRGKRCSLTKEPLQNSPPIPPTRLINWYYMFLMIWHVSSQFQSLKSLVHFFISFFFFTLTLTHIISSFISS